MRRGNGSAMAAALRNVRRVVDELGRLPPKLAVAAAPEITRRLALQFAKGVDPYGRPWTPLRPATLRKHSPPPLTDTGALRDGTKAEPMGGNRIGLTIRVGARYGAFHQVGFRVGKTRVAPRRILPSQGMPAEWRDILRKLARELARKTVGH
jgi:hypothetical protein